MTLAIRSLPIAMVQSACLGTLITAGGRTPLLAPSFRSARFAAVALAVVAMAADEKESSTADAKAKALSERTFRRGPFRRLDFAPHRTTIQRTAGDRTDDCTCGPGTVAVR
jgi:hypothetical protein